MVVRILRAVRKSLEDDGLIGRVISGIIYRTITSIRMIIFVLVPLLWGVESRFGKYTMSPMDRLMMEMFPEPGKYGPLGQALESSVMQVLNKALLAWILFDFALGLLYSVLEWLTLEEHEKAQREYDKMREQLGDVIVDDTKNNFLTSLVESQPFQYIQWGIIIFNAFQTMNNVGTVVSEGIAAIQESSSLEVTMANLAKLNPYRDLLPEQDEVLRELVYMSHILRQLTPTTLPEDDYQLFSNMIRSLETRTDLSWRVYEETNIRQTIMAAASRGYAQKRIAEEPFSIKERVKVLSRHWQDLATAPGKPERWEDASDTTFMRPLIATNSFGEVGAKLEEMGTANARDEIGTTGGGGGFKLALTLEQEAEATRIYDKWRRKRDHKVSYLKDHPPRALGWVPVAKSDTGVRNAWDTLFEDGRVEAGRSASASTLSGSKQWKPIFGSLDLEPIPFDWVPPGEEPQTAEDSKAELEALYKESDRIAERTKKQEEYIAQLKSSMEGQREKREL